MSPSTRVQTGGGHGEGHPLEVSATVITKCGHMFHTDCFKRACDEQSKNAWAQKSCPVCKEGFQMQDMIRVNASSYDRIASVGPPVEDLLRMNEKGQQEKSELLKRLEASARRNKELLCKVNQVHNDVGKISQEREGLQLRLDQLLAIEAISNSEIDMLKNMIIYSSTNKPEVKVSLKSDLELRNDAVPNHQARLAYSKDLQGFPLNELQMLESNRNLPIFSKADDAPKKSLDNWRTGTGTGTGTDKWMGKSLAQHKANFSSQSQRENRKIVYGSSSMAISWGNNNEANFYAKTNEEIIPQPKENALKLQADADDNGSSAENGNFSPGKETDDSDKWLERKSRRRQRTTSKAGNSNRTSNSGSRTDHELPEDRRLYGSYSCTICYAKWGSSRTLLDKPQICRYCKTQVFPHSQEPIISRRQLEMNLLAMKDNPAKANKK